MNNWPAPWLRSAAVQERWGPARPGLCSERRGGLARAPRLTGLPASTCQDPGGRPGGRPHLAARSSASLLCPPVSLTASWRSLGCYSIPTQGSPASGPEDGSPCGESCFPTARLGISWEKAAPQSCLHGQPTRRLSEGEETLPTGRAVQTGSPWRQGRAPSALLRQAPHQACHQRTPGRWLG